MKYMMLVLIMVCSWLMSVNLQAQGKITYILYEKDCMQKYDYIKVNNFPETPFLDFHLTVDNSTKLVFRVRKIKGNSSTIQNFSQTPIICSTVGSKISDNIRFANEVNSGAKIIYIAEASNGSYKTYKVEFVFTMLERGDVFSYLDTKYVFQYNAAKTYGADENLRLDREGEESLTFKRRTKEDCFNVRKFQYKTGQLEDNSENVYFLEGIGFYKSEIITDAIKLVSIDGIPIDRYLKLKCANPSKPVVENNNSSNTTNNNSSNSNNNSNSGGIGSTDGPTGIKTNTNTTNTNNINEGEFVILKPLVISADTKITEVDKKGNISPFSEQNPYTKDLNTEPFQGAGILVKRSGLSSRSGGGGNPDVPSDKKTMEPAPQGFHRVQEGESLYTIAEKYSTTVEKLMYLNQLKSANLDRNQLLRINTGSVAPIPYVAEDRLDVNRNLKLKVHIVRQNDTLYKIATNYNTTIKKLYELNDLKSDALDIKQEIVVSQEPFLK